MFEWFVADTILTKFLCFINMTVGSGICHQTLGRIKTGTQASVAFNHPLYTGSIGHCCLWAQDDSVGCYEPDKSFAKYAKYSA